MSVTDLLRTSGCIRDRGDLTYILATTASRDRAFAPTPRPSPHQTTDQEQPLAALGLVRLSTLIASRRAWHCFDRSLGSERLWGSFCPVGKKTVQPLEPFKQQSVSQSASEPVIRSVSQSFSQSVIQSFSQSVSQSVSPHGCLLIHKHNIYAFASYSESVYLLCLEVTTHQQTIIEEC